MAQDRDDLPEGTDKVVRGASTGGGAASGRTVTADTTLVAEKPIPAPSGTAEKRRSSARRDEGGGSDATVAQKLRSGRDKLSGQAADKARDFVGQGLERSSEALANVSRLVGDTAGGLDERLGPEYGDYARRAAEAIERTAQKLGQKNPDELIDDTRSFVRKSPGVALAGAAIVGFAVARLIKSGLESQSAGEGDEDEGTGGRSSR